jgi:hypothetical protein
VSVSINPRFTSTATFTQVINEFPSATGPESTVHISDLIVEAFGVERVDPNWISHLHQPDAPIYLKDSRVRTLPSPAARPQPDREYCRKSSDERLLPNPHG